MINDQMMSSLASGVQIGAGIVSWGDYAIGYEESDQVVVHVKPASDYGVWKDMAEEPWKYGDDIEDWLDLDTELRQAPGRWRLEAFWEHKQIQMAWEWLRSLLRKAWEDYEDRKDEAATKIQALWRGHMARNSIQWRDCCMCLAHHVSPIRTDVGYMCSQCSSDGPHSDLIGMEDPWDWFRAEDSMV